MQRQGHDNTRGGFFNDMGKSTSTLPPWAHPAPGVSGGAAQQAVPVGGQLGGSQSSTKPPHGVAPIGNPQLPPVAGANADPGKSGGSSGGLTGFGAHDYYNGGTGPDVLAPQAAAPSGGRNTNQNSGEQTNGFFGVDGGGGGYDMGPGLIAGHGHGGYESKDMQDKSNADEVGNAGAAAGTVVGVVVAVIIVIGIFALVAVFLVRQRCQSRVVIGSV